VATRPTVFIHTNDKQMIGAIVSRYSLQRNSRSPDAFDVRIIRAEDHEFLAAGEGRPFLRDGGRRVWRMDDLQSFTPLRFMPPELLGYQGRALVIDPDVFAVGDVWELLSRDMQGKAVLCRVRGGSAGRKGRFATSVMLLDCAKLTHWRVQQDFESMFRFERDYSDWISLMLEPPDSIGLLEEEWNDLDRLTEHTRMLHNTRRETQPWKTGLPVDFTVRRPALSWKDPRSWKRVLRHRLLERHSAPTRYQAHPDPRQEALFFGLLRECLERGIVEEDRLREEMRRNHVRHDALERLRTAEPLPA
jgi:hypothetical protein